MSKRLEDFIKEHKEAFDEHEPSNALWERLEHAVAREPKKASKQIFLITKYAAAAVVTGIVFTLFFLLVNKNKSNNTGIADSSPKIKSTVSPSAKSITDSIIADKKEHKQEYIIAKAESNSHYKKKAILIKKQILPKIDDNTDNLKTDDYQPEYVIINGKPVKNENEAKKITEESLNFLAVNLDKGVENMKNLKYMSINF